MRLATRDIFDFLADPQDHSRLVEKDGVFVSETGNEYPVIDGQPVLISNEDRVWNGWRFPAIKVDDPGRPQPGGSLRLKARQAKQLLRRASMIVRARADFVGAVVTESDEVERPRVLIVGGASVGEGSEPLLDHPDIDVVSFDIYPTKNTTFVADGHTIPLQDDSFDGVWVQAVLEHVYQPQAVVDEISRVLRPGGVVYAETPFLQPVHEGAYDYTRFSRTGHRLLFGRFEEIESGVLGGPAAALHLAVRGVVGGLTRSTSVARIVYFLTLPLTLLDRAIAEGWREDYAVGTYFLGRLATTQRSFDATDTYRGAG